MGSGAVGKALISVRQQPLALVSGARAQFFLAIPLAAIGGEWLEQHVVAASRQRVIQAKNYPMKNVTMPARPSDDRLGELGTASMKTNSIVDVIKSR